MTLAQWLDIWSVNYFLSLAESTRASYLATIRNHIKPSLGKIMLTKVTPDMVQRFYSELAQKNISPKTIKNIHGTLNSAMQQAMYDGKIRRNPCANRTLPRIIKHKVEVMDSEAVAEFLQEIVGHRYEQIYFFAVFTGTRQAEILGLAWKSVDFKNGTIRIDQQLVKSKLDGRYYISTTKHDKVRIISPAAEVMQLLREAKAEQEAAEEKAGVAWQNEWGLVFTDALGRHLVHVNVYKGFKKLAAKMNYPGLKFHCLRHTYAVISLANGDDPKTVQTSLGHHSAAFTLDTYGHTTTEMQRSSAGRMSEFIRQVSSDKEV